MGLTNSSTISASTLAMLLTIPPSKAAKHLTLLTETDLLTYRDFVDKKVAGAEHMLAELHKKMEAPDSDKTDVAYLEEITQKELLACYHLRQKIDKVFDRIQREIERSSGGSHKKTKSYINKINSAILKGGKVGR